MTMIFDDLHITPDRVTRIEFDSVKGNGFVDVIYSDTRTMYCSDWPHCDLEHKVEPISCGASIVPDQDFFLAMSYRFATLADQTGATS